MTEHEGSVPPGNPSTDSSTPVVRYEVTIGAEDTRGPLAVDRFDLDRLPDRRGATRALVTQEELGQLRNAGVPLEVGERLDVAPLDPALTVTDDQAHRWLKRRVHGIPTEKQAP
ncbi:MAG: hypothetical protein KBB39_00240 [Phycicoccus sp.]|nr:hypothetical protein [Phycicoccus sp.]